MFTKYENQKKLCYFVSIFILLFLPSMTYGAGLFDQSVYAGKKVAGATITQGQLLKLNGVGKVIPTTAATDVAVGVAMEAGVLDQNIYVECRDEILVSAAVGITKGQFLIPSTTAGKVDGSTTFVQGAVGKALANESGGFVSAHLFRLGMGYFSISGEGTSATVPATIDFVVGEQGTSDDGGVIMGAGSKFFVLTDNGTATVDGGVVTSDQGFKLDITDDLGATAYTGIHATVTDNANTAGQNAVTGGFFDVQSTIGANNTTVIGKLGQVKRYSGTAGAGTDTWYGLWGKVDGDTQMIDTGYGVYGLAIDADMAYGGYFKTISAGTAGAAVYAIATGAAAVNYGIYTSASGAIGDENYAIFIDGDVLFAANEVLSNPNGSFLFTDSGGNSVELNLDSTYTEINPSTARLGIPKPIDLTGNIIYFSDGQSIRRGSASIIELRNTGGDTRLEFNISSSAGGIASKAVPLDINANADQKVEFFTSAASGERPQTIWYGWGSAAKNSLALSVDTGDDWSFVADNAGKVLVTTDNGTATLDGSILPASSTTPPSASSAGEGATYVDTDQGTYGALMVSDGTAWNVLYSFTQ